MREMQLGRKIGRQSKVITRRKLLESAFAGATILSSPLLFANNPTTKNIANTCSFPEHKVPERKVIVFSGHTTIPEKMGALSCRCIPEYQYNDAVLSYLPPGEGIEYLLVPASENISLKKRPQMAKECAADLYLEIHHDSVPQEYLDTLLQLPEDDFRWAEVRGFSLHYTEKRKVSAQSLALAESLGNELKKFLLPDFFHHRYQDFILGDAERAIYERNLYVTRTAEMPAVLVECGYIINPREERFLTQEETQQRIALALHEGIKNYVGV